MKKIENIQFKPLYENALAQNKDKSKKWVPDLYPEFLDHTLPVLASIPLLKNSLGFIDTELIMLDLDTNKDIKTPNGTINSRNLRYLIAFLHYADRAELLKPKSQVKAPRLASLTPLVLYANKLYNNVPYSDWARDSKYMRMFLGGRLAGIVEPFNNPKITLEQALELREQAYTYKGGKKAGQLEKYTMHMMNITEINGVEFTWQANGRKTKNMIPMFMYLQTWLAHAEVRDTDSMILDPLNWDNIPEPYDAVIAQPAAEPPTAPTVWVDDQEI